VTWLFFEIFVSSTALVLVLHLLVPLFVLADVMKMKEKALVDLMLLREKCSQTTSDCQNGTSPATEEGRQ
jgi:type IV secretory pathway VirB3-like protein